MGLNAAMAAGHKGPAATRAFEWRLENTDLKVEYG